MMSLSAIGWSPDNSPYDWPIRWCPCLWLADPRTTHLMIGPFDDVLVCDWLIPWQLTLWLAHSMMSLSVIGWSPDNIFRILSVYALISCHTNAIGNKAEHMMPVHSFTFTRDIYITQWNKHGVTWQLILYWDSWVNKINVQCRHFSWLILLPSINLRIEGQFFRFHWSTRKSWRWYGRIAKQIPKLKHKG